MNWDGEEESWWEKEIKETERNYSRISLREQQRRDHENELKCAEETRLFEEKKRRRRY